MPKCPRCNQPIRNERFGIYLPWRKARIVDVLAAAGDDGVGVEDLMVKVWGSSNQRTRRTVASHISQLNDLFAGTTVSVRSERRRMYFLEREKRAA